MPCSFPKYLDLQAFETDDKVGLFAITDGVNTVARIETFGNVSLILQSSPSQRRYQFAARSGVGHQGMAENLVTVEIFRPRVQFALWVQRQQFKLIRFRED